MNENILLKIKERIIPAMTAERRRLGVPIRLDKLACELPPVFRSFAKALKRDDGKIAIICELKKASPSKGMIRPDLNAPKLARELEEAGADALSVLTETNFFLGSRENLIAAVDATCRIPVLRKDFIFDPYQVFQARLWGAHAVLLIAAMLTADDYRRLLETARYLGLAVLSEVHDLKELDMVLANGAEIVGVNARNLADFSTSLEAACELLRQVPDNVIKVAESSIHGRDDLSQVRAAGADAALVGEFLMRRPDPAEALRELVG